MLTKGGSGTAVQSLAELAATLTRRSGPGMSRVLVALSSIHLGEQDHAESFQDDPESPESTASSESTESFGSRFLRWSQTASKAGWGCAELLEVDLAGGHARVAVRPPEEVIHPNSSCDASCDARRWIGPLWQGRLEGLFGRIFQASCRSERVEDVMDTEDRMEFRVYAAREQFADHLWSVCRQHLRDVEADLAAHVEKRVSDLCSSHEKAQQRSVELLRQRTRELRDEIVARERAEEFKDKVLATVSHELRTPLSSMLGFTELLRHREFPPEQRHRFLDIIHQETVRLQGMLNDFLDLQRIEQRSVAHDFMPTDVGPLIRSCSDLFATATHRIHLELPVALPRVDGDPERLRQVLTNLISNAIKFSPGSDRVSVGACANDDEVVIWVRDHGIGIPSHAMGELFTKFYRVDDPDTQGIGGTGLGLAIVREVVNAHGGRVWVDSTVGKGSTFFVALPAADTVSDGPS